MTSVPHRKWYYAFLAYVALFPVLLVANYRLASQDLRSLLNVLWPLGALPGFVLLIKRRLLLRLYPRGARLDARGSLNLFVFLAMPILLLFLGPALWLAAIFMWPSQP